MRAARALPVLLLPLGLIAGVAMAQPDRCVVSSFRGQTRLGGNATATMTVVNDGRACSIFNYIDVESKMPPDSITTVRRPHSGTLRIRQPGTVSYRPSPGYEGPDEFTYTGTGRTRSGRLIDMSVTVTVTVLPGPSPEARQKP